MKQVFSATCIAAMFAAGLAAQTTGTAGSAAQDPQAAGGGQGRGAGPTTVTGCLRAGDTAGTYTLTDIVLPPGVGGAAAATTGGSTATGTGTAGTVAGATTGGAQPPAAPMSAGLVPDPGIDLQPHVGHKVEVTGSLVRGARPGGGAPAAAGTATATGGATATGTGTSGTGAGATTGGTGSAATGTGQGRGGPRQMTVTAIRMVSESCS